MRKLLLVLGRYMPLIFLVVAVISVVQFWIMFGPRGTVVEAALRQAAGRISAWAWPLLAGC